MNTCWSGFRGKGVNLLNLHSRPQKAPYQAEDSLLHFLALDMHHMARTGQGDPPHTWYKLKERSGCPVLCKIELSVVDQSRYVDLWERGNAAPVLQCAVAYIRRRSIPIKKRSDQPIRGQGELDLTWSCVLSSRSHCAF